MQKLFFVLAALVMSSWLSAQQDTSFLQEVVVTANKAAHKQNETAKVVSVINREMLQQSGGRSLGELLNQVAGVTVPGANNNLGSNQTISIRGASAGNTLILIDGIPVNDPSVISNYFDINLLSTDQIERVEILKGGHSTLYGSDAVAGVINIISRKNDAAQKHPQWNASLAGGNFATLRSSVGVVGKTKSMDYSVQLSSHYAGGFSAAKDTSGSGQFDNDTYFQQTARAQIGIKTGERSRLSASFLYSGYTTDLDAGAFRDEKDFTANNFSRQFNVGWNRQGAKTKMNFQYQFNQVDRSYLDDSLFISNSAAVYTNSSYRGSTHFAEFFLNHTFRQWELLTGIDFRQHSTVQDYFSTGAWGPFNLPTLKANMSQISGYASLQYRKNNFTAELGGRINQHSVYGTNGTFTFNPAYRLSERVRVFGNWYTAFKTPTLFQLYDPFAGNSNLTPEKGLIQELGFDWTSSQSFQTRVVAFHRNSRETIIYSYDPMGWLGKYLNASRQTNYGVEVEATWNIRPIQFRANYAFTDGRTTGSYDGTGAPLGKDSSYFNLYRIPRHALNWQASFQKNQWTFQLSGRVASAREEFIFGAPPITMKGYATIDVYTEYRTKKKGLRFFVDLRNLTNTRYEEIRGYNARGFTAIAGILWGR
ncbi:MAG: TonB-dependent receptor [Chitinophagaceae bacterium]|nr:TonB-dependent receptor [Chitinophagaceae bacterium]MCA6470560.1 TonB-dependent receptor [Chitinophagaceae bacterium]MCA6478323.1 TonB-dependent receptor [Chitinophagaceae bacterium]MCA6479525.1 TonB-dependent receptor [Chitinophagaceae bacterium]MCA6492065.1 TonB-dependent receptor [Chitinophagaceae bacterium]